MTRPATGWDETRGPVADPALRGRLVITDRAVARIATAVATEIEAVANSRSGRGSSRRAGRKAPHQPRAGARVDGQDVRVSLSVSLRYPAAVAAICDELRERISARVDELTGLRTGAVDIRVPALRPAARPGPGPFA
ncbi:MAG: Asp23/Gls24 family envelope stress response protein [Frankia sp.]